MKICTTEFPDENQYYDNAINSLTSYVTEVEPDLVVLPEMPFTPWVFHVQNFSQERWNKIVETHARWLDQLCEAIPTPIFTSRPITVDGLNLNQAFYVDGNRNIQTLRSKCFLPNDFPAVERVWFDEGESIDSVFEIQGCKLGVQLCSEIMYADVPRILSAKNVQIIMQPRATGGHPRWRAASVLAASTSGAYVVGANRRSTKRDWFSGGGWVYSPEGDLLTETTEAKPFTSIEIDLSKADDAKAEYPISMFRYYE